MLSSPDWQPFWQIAFPDREIEHVDYFSVKPSAVRLVGKERCGLAMAMVKNHSVKNRIDNVAKGACQDERYGYNQVS